MKQSTTYTLDKQDVEKALALYVMASTGKLDEVPDNLDEIALPVVAFEVSSKTVLSAVVSIEVE